MSNCVVKFNRVNSKEINDSDLFLEDFFQQPNIKNARELTNQIFKENKDFINFYDYKGYKISWSWYDNVFQTSLDYLSIKTLIDIIESVNPKKIILVGIPNKYARVLKMYFFSTVVQSPEKYNFFKLFLEFLFNIILIFFTFISLSYFYFRKGFNVATRTEDLIFKNTKSDFRLNHLYNKYEENNIQYVEFIRNTSIKGFFINIYKRKRFAIYYTSVIYFVSLFSKKRNAHEAPVNFSQSILYSYANNNIEFIKSIPIFEKILKILKINNFVLITFSSRTAHLAIAAKSLNIPVIGIMHGLSQKEYAVQEFISSFNEIKKIGCDVYGLWSPYYLEYFKKYSKITPSVGFEYSGMLRPVKEFITHQIFKRVSIEKIKVLLICEPLISALEIIPYLNCLLSHNDIEIAIKIRPMIKDSYYEELRSELTEIKKLQIYDGKIEDVAEKFDVFLGSHSTAVIEASLFGKISILLNTEKFGDYFDIDTLIQGEQLLINSPESLYTQMTYRVNNEESLDTISLTRSRFFGDNKDGAQWVIDQL
jgi:hypothetical protein